MFALNLVYAVENGVFSPKINQLIIVCTPLGCIRFVFLKQ